MHDYRKFKVSVNGRMRGQALAGVACRRRQKNYEIPQSSRTLLAQSSCQPSLRSDGGRDHPGMPFGVSSE
jgi:hypothetical protein